MIGHDSIKSFIQGTLGCGCPEEVFRSIDFRAGTRLQGDAVVSTALIVGNRLLIYVVDADDDALEGEHLALYVAEGKKERDRKGLNRFRLVVATNAEAAPQRLRSIFEVLQDRDERIHLHVIRRDENIFRESARPDSRQSTQKGNKRWFRG
jgi:hypothetical protein